MRSLRPALYLICGMTDFSAFLVIFAVSRGLAEARAETWYLGVVGAGLAFSAGIGSLAGGWLSHTFDARAVFLAGAATIAASVAGCGLAPPGSVAFLPSYWFLGIGLGCLYPPLIGWLNQGEDPHANRRGVSRTLILFCIAWNLGMMCGQLSAGSLFLRGRPWVYWTAFAVALANLGTAAVTALRVRPFVPPEVDEASCDVQTAETAAAFKRLSWIANIGGMFGGSMVLHLLPDLAVSLHIPPDSHGYLLAGWRAVIIGMYLLMHVLAFWHYRLWTSLASQVLAAAGLAVIARSQSAAELLAGLVLLGQLVGYNYFSGLFYSTAGSTHERRTLAAGIHEATLAGGMAVGTLAGGLLGSFVSPRMPYLLAAAVMLVLVAVQAVAWRLWMPAFQPMGDDSSATSLRVP